MRVSNQGARQCISDWRVFHTNTRSMFGEWRGKLYAAWSYGFHFPLCVYDSEAKLWFHNVDHYSVTTTEHKRCAGYRGLGVSTEQLQAIIDAGGLVDMGVARMRQGEPPEYTSPEWIETAMRNRSNQPGVHA